MHYNLENVGHILTTNFQIINFGTAKGERADEIIITIMTRRLFVKKPVN